MSAKGRFLATFHLILAILLTQIHADKTNDNGPARHKRNRNHINSYLKIGQASVTEKIIKEKKIKETLSVLSDIYQDHIRPLENSYKFNDLNKHVITDAEIRAKPLILFVGPWSVGKSSMINYLVGMEDSSHLLHTGAEPTTSDFTVVMHGARYKTVEGMVLATDPTKQFSHLEKFGQGFLEKFQGVEMPNKLLEKATFIDTPGIIENRKQQERGYPFNEVMRWFIDRADLIFVVFDPSKLDVGTELESLFRQLKGRESQIRIILNKADSITPQELMRVYGALFWNLAPLINVTEPPRVYTGSFWDYQFKDAGNSELFVREEVSLLHDLNEVIENQVENKIAFIRQHAYLVRIHALMVDAYLEAFTSRRSIFGDYETLLSDIVENPKKYHIYNSVLANDYISKYDLPKAEAYREFFAQNALNLFKPLTAHCSFMKGCDEQNLLKAFLTELPQLLSDFTDLQLAETSCDAGSCKSDVTEP